MPKTYNTYISPSRLSVILSRENSAHSDAATARSTWGAPSNATSMATIIDGATDAGKSCRETPVDFTPSSPLPGEKPNDLLIRLYEMWPAQHSTSYRRHVPVNREMTAEYNQRYMKELLSAKAEKGKRGSKSFRATAMRVSTVQNLFRSGSKTSTEGANAVSRSASEMEKGSKGQKMNNVSTPRRESAKP